MAAQVDINKTMEVVTRAPNRTIPDATVAPNLFAGRYRKTNDRIGKGGMSDVFVAEDTQWRNQKVAIKIPRLPDDPVKAEACRKRFEREVETAMTLRGNTSILQVYPGKCNGRPYMVMRYLDNAVDLRQYVEETGGRLSEAQTREVLKPIAEALDYAHKPDADHGVVVHRDVKPANILVQKLPDGKLKPWILDFGISKSADQKDGQLEFTFSDFAGTPGYIAPEKLAGDRQPRPAQDVFSFAVVLYECLTGRHPFVGADGTLPTQVVLHQRMVAGDFTRIESATPLARQIMLGLSADPGMRPKTCVEFFAAPRASSLFRLEKDEVEWNGREQRPAVRYAGKENLAEGRDYRVDYERNVAVGEAVAVVLGVSRKYHHLEVELPFKIVPRPISHVEVGPIQPQTYAGGRAAPKLKVSDAEIGYTPEAGRDYEAVPVGPCVAGTGTGKVRLTGRGGYAGTREETFDVSPRRLDGGGFEIGLSEPGPLTYDGQPKRPAICVRDIVRDVAIAENADFEVSYEAATVGRCGYAVVGRGNYAGTFRGEYFVEPRPISAVTVAAIAPVRYQGRPVAHVAMAVADGALGRTLAEGVDFEVEFRKADRPGEAEACLRGLGNYNGERVETFMITEGHFPPPARRPLSYKAEFDGQDHGIEVRVDPAPPGMTVTYARSKDGVHRLENFRYTDVCPETRVWFRLTCEGFMPLDDSGTVEIRPRPVEGLTVSPIADQQYCGCPACPDVEVFDDRRGSGLVAGRDFELKLEATDEPGEGRVTIVGRGNYCGERSCAFKVLPRNLEKTEVAPIPDQPYDGRPRRPTVSVRDDEPNLALVEGRDYSLRYGKRTDVGKSRVQLSGQGNYCGKKTVVFQIVPRDIAQAVVTVRGRVRYTGKPIRHVAAKVVDKELDHVLKEGLDYSLDCENADGPGKATVRIVGKGNYCGETRAVFEILPGQFKPPEVCGHDGEYDGAEHGIVVTPKNAPSGTEVEYALAEDGPYVPQSPAFRDVCDGTRVWFRLTHAGYEPWYGSASVTISPRSVDKLQVDKIPGQTFRGETVHPDITVRDDTLGLLAQGRDYALAYRHIDRPGMGFVVITGCGNYTGVREVEFVIRPPSRFGWKKAVWAAGCALLLAGVGVFGWQTWESAERQKQAEIQRQAKAAQETVAERERLAAVERARKEREAEAERERKRKQEAERLANLREEGREFTLNSKDCPGFEMKMKWCPQGSFLMGSPASEEGRYDDEKQHRVTLTKGFWLGETEVTQGQWKQLLGGETVLDLARKALQDDTLYNLAGKQQTLRDYWGLARDADPDKRCGDRNDKVPVYNVNWHEAKEFCRRLTDQERSVGRLPSGYEYRLPTEAEWEYACRAGTKTALPNGQGIRILGENNAPALDLISWYGGNSSVGFTGGGWNTSGWKEKQYPGETACAREVKGKRPNEWGLYDMIGNVWEWCEDRSGDYGSSSYVSDPTGPQTGAYRVVRGGSWCSLARDCRAAYRGSYSPGFRYFNMGFRVALAPSLP